MGNDADVGPARHRHAVARTDEPQPFPGGGDPLLLTHRADWPEAAAVGKTLVSSGLIDRVVGGLAAGCWKFRWASSGSCRGCSTAAAASAARRARGRASCAGRRNLDNDKDGLILGLLAAEITAVTGRDPGAHYADFAPIGHPLLHARRRADAPEKTAQLKKLDPAAVKASELAGKQIVAKMARAPGNDAPITASRWQRRTDGSGPAVGDRKRLQIYAESFRDQAHLDSYR